MKLTYHPVRLALSLLLATSLLATACGDDNGDAAAAADPTTTEAEDTTADAAAFPVTIEHKYGSTEVPAAPERVVSVGFTDQDFLLALGITPVGIRDWYGDQPDATWPWAQDELGDAEPGVLSAETIEFEQIAALRPDLIVGISSGMTEEEYDKLSQIAPTITQRGDFVDYGTPWQEMTRIIGSAVGRSDEADEIITNIEGRFAQARADHPAFEGASANVGALGDGIVYAYAPVDTRGQFLTQLGFVIPDAIVELAGDQFYAIVSAERLDLLDTDLLVWVTGVAGGLDEMNANPVYLGLDAVKEGRAVDLDDPEISGAMSFSSPLSLTYALDVLVPRFDAALDGDPATPTD
jgi:iron complex transport system substrate-binding protein